MTTQRITQALARIDQAAARLENAAHNRSGIAGAPSQDSVLAEKYETLRSDVASTLGDLDRLIEGLEK
ncbi:hypothetical protein D6851_01560 [Altericroceibacterium spongiae]|uniref:Uncharacterized protein n=1 Tax=Altericroceibacterium spongiae TaxID=2320269 RepID=A0A420ER72_9SPHN|nr:hypothetical protein [Altericroceibacterium spongiae]RKF23196.1 hypothetical protein D6851_01560 [Altericroceibacterium spongiae]